MSDSSITPPPILDLIAGGCSGRHQLRGGIKNVSAASKHRKSLTLVGVDFIGTLAIPQLDGRLLYNHCFHLESDCRGSWGSTLATQRYKERRCGIKTQEIADCNKTIVEVWATGNDTRLCTKRAFVLYILGRRRILSLQIVRDWRAWHERSVEGYCLVT